MTEILLIAFSLAAFVGVLIYSHLYVYLKGARHGAQAIRDDFIAIIETTLEGEPEIQKRLLNVSDQYVKDAIVKWRKK